MVPLARTAQAQIEALQDWAASGKARLASRSNPLNQRLKPSLPDAD